MPKNSKHKIEYAGDPHVLLSLAKSMSSFQEEIHFVENLNKKIQQYNRLSGSDRASNSASELFMLEEEINALREKSGSLILRLSDNIMASAQSDYFPVRGLLESIARREDLQLRQMPEHLAIQVFQAEPKPLPQLNERTLSKLLPATQAIYHQVHNHANSYSQMDIALLNKARQAMLQESLRDNVQVDVLAELRKIRYALAQKINHAIELSPSEVAKQGKRNLIEKSDLAQTISTLPAEDFITLTSHLSELAGLKKTLNMVTNEDQKADIIEFIKLKQTVINELYPALAKYDISMLNAGNNINFKLVPNSIDTENMPPIVLQVEGIDASMQITPLLKHTTLQPFLSDDYLVRQPIEDDQSRGINLKEYADKGDLQNEATKLNESERIEKSYQRFSDLTNFCQKLNAEHAVYTDIKTSNFLIRGDDTVFTADYKSIKFLGDENKLKASDVVGTQDYIPPESIVNAVDIDPEKFMSYQIGLAYYEYLVCPKEDDSWLNKETWIDGGPNFNLPPFKHTPEGSLLKALIQSTLEPEPGKRANLQQIQGALDVLQALPNPAEISKLSNMEIMQNDIKESQKKLLNTATELTEFLSNNSTSLNIYVSGFNHRSAHLNENLATLIQQQEKAIAIYETIQNLPDTHDAEKQNANAGIEKLCKQLNIEAGSDPIAALKASVAEDKQALKESKAALTSKSLNTYLPKESVTQLQENLKAADFKPRGFVSTVKHIFKSMFDRSYREEFGNLQSKLSDIKSGVDFTKDNDEKENIHPGNNRIYPSG